MPETSRSVPAVSAAPPIRLHRPQLSGVFAMAAAAGVIAWIVSANARHGPLVKPVRPVPVALSAAAAAVPAPAPRRHHGSLVIRPVALSAARLAARARALGEAVYWVGPAAGHRYELSRSRAGEVVVRYLPAGARAGSRSAPYVTVGTTPFPDAFAEAQATIQHVGIRWLRLADGGLASFRKGQPELVFVAYPGIPYRIAVFDPVAAEARALVASGNVRPVG